ncbi:MAG: NAD kinase [Bacteroidetes bacterium 4572_77]|nr:MAG: NAD kinase [Bacteroidetes bacterium 4572_77]
MKIGIFGKNLNKDTFPFIQNLFNKLGEINAEVYIFEEMYEMVKHDILMSTPKIFRYHEDIRNKLDFFLSLGGDGNMLSAVTLVRDSGIPIIGINLGRLGFLASINKEHIHKAIDCLIKKDYTLESRSLLKLSSPEDVFEDLNFALNEITIYKRQPNSMVSVVVKVNGQYLNSYWADGLIVATPTGSTAYSLSTGGPIIHPDSNNFIITPIAPHNLSVRPVVIPDSSTINMQVAERDGGFLVSLDSRTVELQSGVELSVEKEAFSIQLVRLPEETFFGTIRAKLLWGIDKRN